MVHALQQIRQVLVPNGILVDVRPVADEWPVEIVSRRERRPAGHVTDLPAGLEDDEAAHQAVAVAAERGWFNREKEGSFPFDYYWDSPSRMQDYVRDDWEDFVGISDDVWKKVRSEWATADADARLRVRVHVLITAWRKQS